MSSLSGVSKEIFPLGVTPHLAAANDSQMESGLQEDVEPRQSFANLDRWMERASQKEAAMAGRSEGQRQKMEEMAREAQELAQWNERWAKL